MSTPTTPPPRAPLSPMHWIVGGAAIAATALIMGAMWAVADRGIGLAAMFIGLSVISTAIAAVAVAEVRSQRRHDEVLAAIAELAETLGRISAESSLAEIDRQIAAGPTPAPTLLRPRNGQTARDNT